MRTLLATAALWLTASCIHGPGAGAVLANWRTAHPEASMQLCDFSRGYPSEAGRLRRWMREHPVQATQLVSWAAENGSHFVPDAMLRTHSGAYDYQPLRDPAVYALLDWAAVNPDAAEQLADTPHGLEYALEPEGC